MKKPKDISHSTFKILKRIYKMFNNTIRGRDRSVCIYLHVYVWKRDDKVCKREYLTNMELSCIYEK